MAKRILVNLSRDMTLSYSRISKRINSRDSMRKMLVSLIGLIFYIACHAQTGYLRSFTIHELELGYLREFTPKTIYVCSDNGLVILGDAGFIEDPMPWFFVPIIIRLDSQGNLLWHRVIDIIYENIIGVGIEQNDVVHFVMGKPSGYRVGFIDANGSFTLREHKTFVNNQYGNPRFNKGIRLDNGEIVACGRIGLTSSYGFGAALFRLSSVGDSLAATYYPPDTQEYDFDTNAVNLVQRDDNSLHVACYLNSENISILHTDMNGSIINRYNIGGSDQYYGATMFQNSDFLSVFTVDSSDGNHNTLITSIDISGNSQTYNLGSEMYYLCSVVSSSEYFILLGCDIIRSIRITKFNQFLSEVWSVAYDTIGLSFPSPPPILENIKMDQQGCIFFVGTTGVTNIVAVKLLPNGQVSNLDELNIPNTQTINAYPNPTHDFPTIELKIDAQDRRRVIEIEVYNIRGQKVSCLKSNNTFDSTIKIVWDRKDSNGKICPAGIYLVRDSLNPSNTVKLILIK
ncbi:MAG: T9SS type A sorting domain-containing protein [Candidatus Cloacimonetes bacterium]|nr:T9SS type A sorting domain-containing protein [Candidatus Cloacimonadota bacterium]